MPTSLRLATFNVENLDDRPGRLPSLEERIALLRPQLVRLRSGALVEGLPWPLALSALLVIYLYSHYAFASMTAHVTAMFPASSPSPAPSGPRPSSPPSASASSRTSTPP